MDQSGGTAGERGSAFSKRPVWRREVSAGFLAEDRRGVGWNWTSLPGTASGDFGFSKANHVSAASIHWPVAGPEADTDGSLGAPDRGNGQGRCGRGAQGAGQN